MSVPLTVADVFCTPLLTVNCRFWGALAVMVTVPGAEQVTSPVEPIVAATVPVLVGEVFHERPSTRKNLDAKQEASTGGDVVGRFPEVSMRSSRYPCRGSVRIAEGECRKGASYPSIRPRFRNHEWSALSFAFMWDVAGIADGGCKAGIPGRPPMRSAVRLRNLAPDRWPCPPNSIKVSNRPTANTPPCQLLPLTLR